jgi:hypothetical protein
MELKSDCRFTPVRNMVNVPDSMLLLEFRSIQIGIGDGAHTLGYRTAPRARGVRPEYGLATAVTGEPDRTICRRRSHAQVWMVARP